MKRILLLLASIAFLAACLRMPAGIAPSNIPVDPTRPYESLSRVKGTDTGLWLFGFIPISGVNELDVAYQDALKSAGNADAMIEVTVEFKRAFWIILTQHTTIVHGNPIRFKPMASLSTSQNPLRTSPTTTSMNATPAPTTGSAASGETTPH